MGMFSKMTIMKVLEVVWEVSGFSGKVGIWSSRAFAHFRNFQEVDLRQSPRCQMPISHFRDVLELDSYSWEPTSFQHRC